MHVASPKKVSGPGVLVLHSWWGLNEFFRGFCDRLAGEGFVALAPDLIGGRVATTETEARQLRAWSTRSRREPAYRYLMRMIAHLSAHEAESGSGIGVIGFSMGGHWAYWLAQRPELPITATVTFYAARNGAFSESRSSFLAHFAETDKWVSAASIKKLKRSLASAGKRAQFCDYLGTCHWFFEEDRHDAFDSKAAKLAWNCTLVFLNETLGQKSGGHVR